MIIENKQNTQKRKSNIYSQILFLKNSDLTFNYHSLIENFMVFSPKHHLTIKYFEAAKQLFKEITTLNIRQVWVCYRQTTVYPIRVYFTCDNNVKIEPQEFPISSCCSGIVYIEFISNFSGSIRCPQCSKKVFQFVNVSKAEIEKEVPDTIVIHEKRLKISKRVLSELKEEENEDKINRKVFYRFHEGLNNKRKQVSRLISSKKYQQKPLKSILDPHCNQFQSNADNQEFIIQAIDHQSPEKQSPQKMTSSVYIVPSSNYHQRTDDCADCVPQLQLKQIINEIFS